MAPFEVASCPLLFSYPQHGFAAVIGIGDTSQLIDMQWHLIILCGVLNECVISYHLFATMCNHIKSVITASVSHMQHYCSLSVNSPRRLRWVSYRDLMCFRLTMAQVTEQTYFQFLPYYKLYFMSHFICKSIGLELESHSSLAMTLSCSWKGDIRRRQAGLLLHLQSIDIDCPPSSTLAILLLVHASKNDCQVVLNCLCFCMDRPNIALIFKTCLG